MLMKTSAVINPVWLFIIDKGVAYEYASFRSLSLFAIEASGLVYMFSGEMSTDDSGVSPD